MSPESNKHTNEPRLRDTLRDDLRQFNHWNTFRKEYRGLKEFYIDEEKKKSLEAMSPIQRWLHLYGWLLKSMLMRLTPMRRLLLVFGILLILLGSPSISYDHHRIEFSNFGLVGEVAILLVLMLELKDKLLAKDELVAGQKVQRSLMPQQSPSVPGWSLWIYSRPANEVGGDLIDFLPLAENRFGLALADVSGKGLQAALIMAKLQATLKALAPDYDAIERLVTKLNVIFHRDGLPNTFASLVYAEIAPMNGVLQFVNAGHLPPVLLTAEGLQEMGKGEAALGLMGSTTYGQHRLELQSGDVFLVYSDGLTEARNEWGEFFGTERMMRRLPSLRERSAEEIGKALLGEIDFFVKDAPPNDDLSLVILKKQ
ncbi:MAG TPA: PP2C family protein-serine/threonine phosphatase [Bacteroidota bacterium]|nr:PP2C family protein-serine/threonine phosphatase [Bacteroidota bacterium]